MRKLLPVFLLAALAAVGYLAWQRGWFVAGGPTRDEGVPVDAAPAAVGGAGELAGSGRRAADPEADPATYEGDDVGRTDLRRGSASVRGRVVSADGPVRFARVVAVLPPPVAGAVRTRKDGTFELRGLPSGDLDLRVSALDFLSKTFLAPGLSDDAERDVGDLLLKRRPPLTDGLQVRVLDEAGRPIAGAKVTASTLPWGLLVTMNEQAGMPDVITRTVTADDLGMARLQPLPPERYDVVARAPDYTLDGVAAVVVASGRVEQVSLTLKRALTIQGTVVDAEGAPVPNAFVSGLAIPSFRSYELVTTDATGQFTLGGLAAGTYMLIGGRDDKGDGMTPNVKAGDRGARVRLSGAGSLRGRVLEADGTPARKFVVRPYTGDPFRYNYSRQFAFDDADGRFVLPMRPGAYSLDVKSDSGAFTTSKAVTVTGGEGAEIEVRLPAAGVVAGVVTDADGNHLAGAEVFVKRGGFPPEPVREQYARADADGHFVVKGLALEPVKLHVRHAGHATTVFDATATPADKAKEVTIRMGTGARVVGHVFTKGGRPVEGLQVNLSQGLDFFSARTTFTGADGAFTFRGVAEGKYQVSTGRFENGASGQRKEATVPAEGDVVVEFQTADDAEATAVVTGRVTVAGKAAAKTSVFAEDVRGSDASVSTESDADGRFRLEGLKPGRVRVWVQTSAGLSDSRTVTVGDAGTPATVEFAFGSAGFRATLVGPDGKTLVTGAWVVLEVLEDGAAGDGWEGVRAQVNSDAQGVVQATGLTPGTYRLRIAGTGYAAKVTDGFAVGDGESKELGTIRLAAGGGLSGKVVDGAGAPVEGIGVSIRNPRGESVFLFNMASTGSNGRYELQGVELGTYRVRFEGKGYAPVEQEVNVTAQGAVADAVMVRGGTLVARVEDERGQPVADARVVLFDAAGRRLERTLSVVNLFDADATRTGSGGTATVPDLAPGSYRATVEKDRTVAVGEPVGFTIDAGGRTSVTLVVKPTP